MTDELNERIRHAIASNGYGWCTVDKAAAMVDLILEEKPALCVEIGVYGGRSLIPQAIALSTTGGMIVGIDPWSNAAASEGDSDEANRNWWASTNLRVARDYCEQQIFERGLGAHCAIIPSRSEHVVGIFADASVGILHIDGNHTELASVRDVNLWLPKVKPRGYIWFDDFNWTTTQRALSILDERCERIRDVVATHTAVRLYRLK